MVDSSLPKFPEAVTSLIHGDFLQSVFALGVPWPKDAPPSGKDWAQNMDDETVWKSICWEPLVALSKLDLEQMPDFFSLLPEPGSHDFPVQALGLVILIDQGPRHLCSGRNERWRNAFFDVLALKLSFQLRDLPPSMRIDSFKAWEKLGYSFAHWCPISVLVVAPFAHSEDLAIHETILLPEVQERRKEVEQFYKTTDEYHAKELAQGQTLDASSDTLAFARFIREGMPSTADISDAAFWFCRVKEAHVPIVRIFGRYPYRNRAMGRETTKEEEVFLEQSNNFGVSVDEDAAKKIREDVEKGVWTPLTQGGVRV